MKRTLSIILSIIMVFSLFYVCEIVNVASATSETISDMAITGTVKLNVQDTKGDDLVDSDWKLYKSDGTQISVVMRAYPKFIEYTYTQDGTITTLSTCGYSSLVVSELPYGDYYFLETKAPTGYVLSTKKYEFSITESGEAITITAKHTQITGTVNLNVQDGKRNSITGSEWALYKSDGTPVLLVQSGYGGYTYWLTGRILTLETDNKGYLVVGSLPYGSYYLLETKAPIGYNLSTEKYEFSITEVEKRLTLQQKTHR